MKMVSVVMMTEPMEGMKLNTKARTPQSNGRSSPVMTAVRKKSTPVRALIKALRMRYFEIWRVIRSNMTATFMPLLLGTAANSLGITLCRSSRRNRKKI